MRRSHSQIGGYGQDDDRDEEDKDCDAIFRIAHVKFFRQPFNGRDPDIRHIQRGDDRQAVQDGQQMPVNFAEDCIAACSRLRMLGDMRVLGVVLLHSVIL